MTRVFGLCSEYTPTQPIERIFSLPDNTTLGVDINLKNDKDPFNSVLFLCLIL